MKKILLITALFAGLAGSGFATSSDSNDSPSAEVFDRNHQKYDQILLAGIKDIEARSGEWTEKQKIEAIDNLNKFENNETQASGHEITADMTIEMSKAFPNTWECISDCFSRGEVELENVGGAVKYKYVNLEDADPEQKQLRINLGYVCSYNEQVRHICKADLNVWARFSPQSDEIDCVNEGLGEGVLIKQPLGTGNLDREGGWTVRFVQIPNFDE